MNAFSIIKKSQLEGATRIDAEYYQPEYLEMEEKIKKFENYLLRDIIEKFSSGKNLRQSDYSSDGVKFIRTQNVRPIIIDKDGLSCLSEKETAYPELKEGDLLFVRVGEGVGNSSVVTPEFSGSTFSDNVIRARIKKLDPYFVSIFLNSKFGFLYWDRVSKGTARSLVSSEEIFLIRIPFISKEFNDYCKKNIIEASLLLIESEKIYQQAEGILLDELGLKDYKKIENLSVIVNSSEIENSKRMDAEYFQEKYKIVLEKIQEKNAKKLGDLVSMKKGIEVGAEEYQEPTDAEAMAGEGRKIFIRVSSMTKFGIVESDQKYLSENLYEKLKKDFEPKKGEILLTKDATPGIAYVLKHDIQGIISGGTLRLKLKDNEVEDEYLALCLNSFLGQMQAERDAGGSVIAHWKPEQIKNVLIPILPKKIQEKISDLVKQSFESRKKSKELLEEAKRKVEEMIEKGGGEND